jgi:hypothetical protein
MPLDFPNIVPESNLRLPDALTSPVPENIVPDNNLRLPDAITIKHGPTRLIARFVLEGDKAARGMGLHLRVRHDFDEMLFLNRREAGRGNWYPIPDMFNPERVELNSENAFWVSGENADGEIVVTFGGRVHDWHGTNLAEQARALFYGQDCGQPCIVTAEAAHRISGVVVAGAVAWVRPDYRRQHLSRLIPRIGKAYACARWPIDWIFGYVTRKHAEQGMPASYGHRNVGYSVSYPGTPWLDLAIAYSSADDIYDDMANFLANELSEVSPRQAGAGFSVAAGPTVLEHIVTKTSSDGVFHGNSSLS